MDTEIPTLGPSLFRILSDESSSNETREGVENSEGQKIYQGRNPKTGARWGHIRQPADVSSSLTPATNIDRQNSQGRVLWRFFSFKKAKLGSPSETEHYFRDI